MTETTDQARVAIDTGGTFTDVALRSADGRVTVQKVPSRPSAPDDAVLAGLRKACTTTGVPETAVSRLVHGTTVATNALLTRGGARVGLVTTAGFRDVLTIGYQTRPSLYDPLARHPAPLVPPERTWEVDERVLADGSVRTPLPATDVHALTTSIKAEAPDVVVVALLNSYVNPDHERECARLLGDAGAAPVVFAATDVAAEMREYERISTAVLNGYVEPVVAGYVGRLESRLAEDGLAGGLWIMQSNGGLMNASAVRRQSVRTILSGLAGGVIGAARWAHDLGLQKAVSLDIGGTSTDIALIRDGKPDEVTSAEIDGFPMRMPAVDVHTIGAGGGSIAWRDAGGGLRVGPQSAGADPGPVSYGRGGDRTTVTDAHLLLGRLGTDLLDGELSLDAEAARTQLALLADALGLPTEETAAGVLRVANATIARGIRAVSVERGVDVRDCTLIAFGGAGPLHGAELLHELGMRAVVVPPHPGIASAVGMLDAPIRHDFAAAATARSAADLPDTGKVLDALAADALAFMTDAEDLPATEVDLWRGVDARYLGQSYELTIDWRADFDALRTAFDAAHLERYGFADDDATLEIVAVRVTATAPMAESTTQERTAPSAMPTPVAHRTAYIAGAWHETPVYRRDALPADQPMAGPLIVEQLDSTVVVAAGQLCTADAEGFLRIEAEGAR
ncbi:MAG: hydantoinase/oxoprolinase family protein [Streptosporangiales bacterium]|nr:hydantoinase/oxoprolinase family protein [Streptosporangiales bacterium]